MMGYRIISIFLCFICFHCSAQQYIGKNGSVSFFSEAPMEDIQATNNNVSSVYDANTNKIVFQLKIKDFIFPKKLMQEHFNENYLESDLHPTSTFEGNIIDVSKEGKANVEGVLNIHGVSNNIVVEGILLETDDLVNIKADFVIKLKDYNIDIPKIVIYNIAEFIDIKVDIELKKI